MGRYYYSRDNQAHGPVTSEQLKALADAGRIRPTDWIWKEGATRWKPASSVRGLFSDGQLTETAEWYYVVAGQRYGPVKRSDLQKLLHDKRVGPSDLVWKEGMAEWVTAYSVPDLQGPPPALAKISWSRWKNPLKKLRLPVGRFRLPNLAKTKRLLKWSAAFACLVGLVYLLVPLIWKRQPPGEALMQTQSAHWMLEGAALKEAVLLLKSDEAQALFVGVEPAPNDQQKEQELRRFLRDKRSANTRNAAAFLLHRFDPLTQQILQEHADEQQTDAEHILLEWLTYEGAIDFDVIHSIWNEQGNFQGKAAETLETLLDPKVDNPSVELGSRVLDKAEDHITVNLFGAQIKEEILSDMQPKQDGDEVIVFWRSNIAYLRRVLFEDSPTSILEQRMVPGDGTYLLNVADRLKRYLRKGAKQHWALLLWEKPATAEGSGDVNQAVLKIAQAARTAEFRQNAPKSPQTSREKLAQLFARLAPSVPVVEAISRSSGSGFLIEHDKRLYIVTNRHVIQNAAQGIQVHFLATETKQTLTIPREVSKVVAIHRQADVALIDVTKAAENIKLWELKPLTLAPAGHRPKVGEEVFAIGHPGAGSTGLTLTSTLGDGIISAVDRQLAGVSFLQVTVPLNPGNSGGPLFDYEGRVIGVNTFIIRKNEAQGLALEALNFALDVKYVHELLQDPNASLSRKQIAAVVAPDPTEFKQNTSLFDRFQQRNRELSKQGYQPYGKSFEDSSRIFKISPQTSAVFTAPFRTGEQYAINVVSQGVSKLQLGIVDRRGQIVAGTPDSSPDPLLQFRCRRQGTYSVVVSNATSDTGVVVLTLLKK
ncbi:MAG: hypothetical protein KatS3mg105_2337 [Gemmatales bacterium]|nr:MAG: hypothetical protein KatS3mg105_2337 [Gemmatales bacterium]